jgi:hypothetical protein
MTCRMGGAERVGMGRGQSETSGRDVVELNWCDVVNRLCICFCILGYVREDRGVCEDKFDKGWDVGNRIDEN